MLVIGFIGGAGVGKSTLASTIFVELKKRQYKVEQIEEFAKKMTWEESFKVLDNQVYVFGNQHHGLWCLKNMVDIAITDSPLLLSSIYLQEKNKPLDDLIIHEWKKYNNLLFYIERSTNYDTEGRNQTLEEALLIDQKILTLLHKNNISYEVIKNLENAEQQIIDTVINRLRK